MRQRLNSRYLTLAILFVAFPFRLETDDAGHWVMVPPYAHAKSGPGSDGDGGDDGEGDDGEGDTDGDDGEGDDDGDDDDKGDDDEGDDAEDSDDDNETGSSADRSVRPVDVQKLSNGARVVYSDGSREEIKDGNFLKTNAIGRVIERRRAKGSDLVRMRAYFSKTKTRAGKAPAGVKSRAVKATYRGQNVEILYANGWREEITSGRYTLTDKYGRVVTTRRATQADRNRLNRFRK